MRSLPGVLGCVVVLLLAPRLARAESPAAAFWRWFATFAPKAASAREDSFSLREELATHFVQAAGPGLEFSLPPATSAEEHVLVISAHAKQEHLAEVKRLVATAPHIPGWKVVAFSPRNSGYRAEVPGGVLDEHTVRFLVTGKQQGRFVVAVYTSLPHNDMDIFELLYAVVGEYDLATRLYFVDGDASKIPPEARPLSELPRVLAATK